MLWQRSHFRQKRCQFLPKELTFSAVGNKVDPGCQESSSAPGALLLSFQLSGGTSPAGLPSGDNE